MTMMDLAACINRNILECKVGKDGRKCLTKIRINRNILECKVSAFQFPL